MRELRTWRRHHVDGVVSEVASVPGIGYWEAWVSHGDPPTTNRLGEHFALLTVAQERADSLAQTLVPHDCSSCGRWNMVDRRQSSRDPKR